MKEILTVVGLCILFLLLIVLWPFAIMWALNTLFSLGIAYNFWSWLAVLVFQTTFGSAILSFKR